MSRILDISNNSSLYKFIYSFEDDVTSPKLYKYALWVRGYDLPKGILNDLLSIDAISIVEGSEKGMNFFENEGGKSYFTGGCIDFIYKESIPGRVIITPDGQDDTYNPSGPTYFCFTQKEHLDDFTQFYYSFVRLKPGDIIVYDGSWDTLEDEEKQQIDQYSWDSVILPEDMKSAIINETEAFFSGKLQSIYDKLNISYKRGFIFIGPPGCGKTLTARVIASIYRVPFIYVKSLDYFGAIRDIYNRAAEAAPCIVMLEDVDTLISVHHRTKFLNTLDGLIANKEILTIATTNNPADVDPALLNRPSRFDKKFMFNCPSVELKKLYLNTRLAKLYNDGDIDEESIDNICRNSKDFTYAMLQELVISAAYKACSENKGINETLATALKDMQQQVVYGDVDKMDSKLNCKAGVGFRSSVPD